MSTNTISPVDAEPIRRLLDGGYVALREHAREVLSRPEFVPVYGLPREQHREQTLARLRTLTREGLTVAALPAQYGGSDDVGAAVVAYEMIAYSDLNLSVKIGAHFVLARGAVQYVGSAKHHERYLPDMATLQRPGCAAMTEVGHGSNLQGMRTTATYDPAAQEFVIHTPDADARKEFIGNAARDGRVAVVFARLIVAGADHGVHALVMDMRDAHGRLVDGMTVEDCGDKAGLNGVDNGRISFDQVRVGRDALLDRYAQVSPDGVYTSSIDSPAQRFFTMIGILITGRVSVAGASVSNAKTALTIAVRYALTRRQFGPARGEEELLLDYPVHQRRLLPALATTYALHFAQQSLVAELQRAFTDPDYPDAERRQFEARAAALKAAASWHAMASIQQCREACGGAGYMSPNRFGTLRSDADPFTTFEGDNNVLLQLVAKSLLTGHKDQFEELDPLGTVAYVAGKFYETLIERTAARALVGRVVDELAAVRRDDDGDLLDRSYQLALMRWREDHLTSSLARRLKRGVDAGNDPYTVFKDCQDHAAALARAYTDRIVLEAFDEAIQRCPDPRVADVLDVACDLHALSTVERDRGWFLEHGRISSTRSKATTRAVNRLCTQLRDHAGVLVDAFGIPDAVLDAPIALCHS